LTRAFIADAQGVERYDYPHDPTVIGKDFSFRDWFQGAAATRATYVSAVYNRAALGQPLVVSIATPI
jgi:hypothetical protein